MAKVLVIYASDYGNTKKAAEAVVEGVNSVQSATATLKAAEDITKDDMLAHDAYIMGSPVHMGCMDWRLKRFIDKVCSQLWMGDELVGRVGGVFTTGSGYGSSGGGCEITMLSMYNNFAELGLILIPLPKCTPGYKEGGLQWGPHARSAGPSMEQTGISKESLQVVHLHGANIARAALALKGKELFCR